MNVDRAGIDWSMFEEDRLEMILLGVLYRTRHSQGYRRAPDERPRDVDHVTGAPLREASLLPVGHAQWISGIEFALSSPLYPDKLATACLGLYWKSRLRPLSGEEMERLSVETQPGQTPHVESSWTNEENLAHAELVYRWKKLLLRFEEKGWAVIEPPVVWSEEFRSGRGKDGLPRVARATYRGLDEAERRIPGTKYAKGAYAQLACAPEEVLAHARKTVPWAVEMSKKEVAGA